MAYKDKDKQREANAERQRRYKARHKGVTFEGVTDKALPEGVTGMIEDVAANGGEYSFKTVKGVVQDVHHTKPKRGKDIKCFADLPPDIQLTIDYMSTVDGKIDQAEKSKRTKRAIQYQHLFPDKYNGTNALALTDAECEGLVGSVIGKPGDADYNGICTDEWRRERGR